jgi:DNA-binding response OmpR family regulator
MPMCNKILLVEDEKDLARAESKILEFNKYEVKVANNGQEALDMQKEDNFDVVILDIMMPVMDGMTCLKEMRKTGINTPVILLTAKAQVDDKVEGLDAGANDYLVKPFNMKELLARIRVLTRDNEQKNNLFVVGNITFDKEKAELSNNKQMVFKLSDKETGIMEMLIKNQDRKITKAELGQRVWQDDDVEDASVKMYMSYLKEKFSALESEVVINEEDGYKLEKL